MSIFLDLTNYILGCRGRSMLNALVITSNRQEVRQTGIRTTYSRHGLDRRPAVRPAEASRRIMQDKEPGR